MPAALPVIDATAPLCCAPLGSAEFAPDQDADELAARLRAMADANRVRILQALSCCTDHRMTTTDVAGLLDVSAATANHHLRQLEKAGLVTPERDGARVQYSLQRSNVQAVGRALTMTCAAECC